MRAPTTRLREHDETTVRLRWYLNEYGRWPDRDELVAVRRVDRRTTWRLDEVDA